MRGLYQRDIVRCVFCGRLQRDDEPAWRWVVVHIIDDRFGMQCPECHATREEVTK